MHSPRSLANLTCHKGFLKPTKLYNDIVSVYNMGRAYNAGVSRSQKTTQPSLLEVSAMEHANRGFIVLLAIVLFNFCYAQGGKAQEETKSLLSFETSADLNRCTGSAIRKLVGEHATDGRRSLLIDLSEATPTFAIQAGEKPFDFRGWDKLKLDIYREGHPISIHLRVHDRKGNRYVSWYYLVRTGYNVVEYSIWGMSSAIDISQIDKLAFYTPKRSGKLYIDNVRLTKGRDDDSWLLPKIKPKPLLNVRGNLIRNGDFEFGLQYWGSWGQWDGGAYIFGCGMGEDAYSGTASAAIICQRRGRGGIFTSPSARFQLKPGEYRFSFFAKGSDKGVRMFWQFEGQGREGAGLSYAIRENYGSKRFDVPTRWTKYEYRVKVVRDVGPLAIYFYSVGGGILFIDAVSLVREGEVTEAVATPRQPMKPSKVEIRGTVTYVNGKPFFPIGFYNAEPESLRGTGFNFICRDPGPGMPGLEFLDHCYANGIMVSINMEGIMRAHLPWQAPELIEPFKNHPAVFGWYVCDEPDHPRWTVPPPEMRLATSLLHRTDPNHPTWTVVMPWADSNIYQYADTVDIIATDMYPIADYNRQLIRVAHATDVLRRAVKWERPVWMVTEATSKATPQEEYAMTYLAVTHGANGIIYWNFNSARRNPKIWNTMVRISLELKRLTPALTSPTSKRD
ncbi:MAG TPA: hypothetical protein EYP10_14720, partial [Armatimonadetes bacterium]|nr:hypothetical protein [Armatimonadota bacterium]